jgi:hypothetical protein
MLAPLADTPQVLLAEAARDVFLRMGDISQQVNASLLSTSCHVAGIVNRVNVAVNRLHYTINSMFQQDGAQYGVVVTLW